MSVDKQRSSLIRCFVGADTEILNIDGDAALMLAASQGHTEVVTALLEYGECEYQV